MATNKNAMARYRALDKCFSSRTRKYYMNDLIEACRMALERQNGDSGSKGAEGVQRRQIFDDMNDMELMYGVIIDRIQDGHKKYYRYAVGSKTMYNPQIEMFARFKMKSSFHKTKRII